MLLRNMIKNVVYRIRGDYTTEKLVKMGMTVGKDFNRMIGVTLDPSHCWLIEIGDSVTLAPHVHVLAHDASTKMYLGYTKIGNVVIGNRVFIGAESVILPGVTIGDDVIVGANSTVTKDLPGGYVYAGSPCKRVCSIKEYLNKNRELMKCVPCYDATYTLRQNVDSLKKQQMKKALKNSIGYVE